MPTLVIADSDLRPLRRIDLDERSKLTIGRSTQRDLIIDEPDISRLHCVVYEEAGEWCIADAGSSGGTYVDHERVVWKRLKPGRVAQVGGVSLWIEASEATPGKPAALYAPARDQSWDLRPEPSTAGSKPASADRNDDTSAFLGVEGDFLPLEPEPSADE